MRPRRCSAQLTADKAADILESYTAGSHATILDIPMAAHTRAHQRYPLTQQQQPIRICQPNRAHQAGARHSKLPSRADHAAGAQNRAKAGARAAPEHRPNLKHAVRVAADGHLLVQLRRLRQARRRAKVVGVEHGGAALARAGDQLGRVDLLEALRQERLAEQLRGRRGPSEQQRGVAEQGSRTCASRWHPAVCTALLLHILRCTRSRPQSVHIF